MKCSRIIPLTKNCVAIVSAEDYRRVNRHKWRVSQSKGSRRKHGAPYAKATIKGKDVYLHRFVLGVTDPLTHVDHKNHCTLDCRRCNLEAVGGAENLARRRRKVTPLIHPKRKAQKKTSPAQDNEPIFNQADPDNPY